MARYLLSRLVQSIFVLVGLAIVVFIVSRMIGDVARLMLPLDADQAAYERMRAYLRLDDPIAIQFLRYAGGLLQGDFGISLWQNIPAMDVILSRFPATALLALSTIVFSLAVAVPLGIVAALRPGSWVDRLATVVSIMGLSVPAFWLALMFITVISVQWRLLPTSGYGSWQNLVLPVMALSSHSIGRLAQVVRTSMLDVLRAPFLTTARSKGIREWAVLIRHALRNALLPILTMAGDDIVGLLSGSVAIELIFGWPGIGNVTLQAIQQRDFVVIQAAVMFIAFICLVANFIIDLLYAWLDPRIRYS